MIYIMIFLACVLKITCNDGGEIQTGSNVEAESAKIYLSELIDKLEFGKLSVEEVDNEWERIFNKGLLFELYDPENNNSPCMCRDYYFERLGDPLKDIDFNKEEIYFLIDKYYGTDILPESNVSLEEIDQNALPIDIRMQTPPQNAKAEFYERAKICKTERPSGDSYYQTGRAADDVIKLLVANDKINYKELTLFSYFALFFYKMAIENNCKEVDHGFIYYKMAVLYIYIYHYDGLDAEHEYNKHSLLMADTYLRIAEEKYAMCKNVYINDFPYDIDYYHACVLDRFISIFECTNDDIKSECVAHAKKYNANDYLNSLYKADCEKFISKYRN